MGTAVGASCAPLVQRAGGCGHGSGGKRERICSVPTTTADAAAAAVAWDEREAGDSRGGDGASGGGDLAGSGAGSLSSEDGGSGGVKGGGCGGGEGRGAWRRSGVTRPRPYGALAYLAKAPTIAEQRNEIERQSACKACTSRNGPCT